MSDLYLLGNQKCLEMKRIAVVGTRRATQYGREMTRLFVSELVKNDLCIVSGLASGIDSVAHETALENKGFTIAVLGHGVDMCYPPQNEQLKQRILDNGGLLVSEYGEGVRPTPDKFRARDALMARLSQAILVIESPRRSGVKITVKAASELGVNVYVLTGPLTSSNYWGNVEIIRDGGIPVYNPQDLIEQLGYTDPYENHCRSGQPRGEI
ncbi:DNA-protecting protein DprA [Candidatus Woesebacteria bacterium]|nr:DNA-protecting protein DprA [Candidatus Woesebacteria bacterium]